MRPPMNFPLSGKQAGGGPVPVGTELLLNATDWNGITSTPGSTPPTSWYVDSTGTPVPQFSATGGVLTYSRNSAAAARQLVQDITVETGVYYLGRLVCTSTGGSVAMDQVGGFLRPLDSASDTFVSSEDALTTYSVALADATSATFGIRPSATTQTMAVDSASLVKLGNNLLSNALYSGGWSPVTGTPGSTPPTGWTQPGSWLFSVDGDGYLVCDRNGTGGINSTQTVSVSPSTEYVFAVALNPTANDILASIADNDGQSASIVSSTSNVVVHLITGASATQITVGWRPASSSSQTDRIAFFGLFEVP